MSRRNPSHKMTWAELTHLCEQYKPPRKGSWRQQRPMGLSRALRRKFAEVSPPCCSGCGLADVYNGLPLPLDLDHVDGNWKNNDPANLRWLCPNCHSQTDTYAGRNVRVRAQGP